MAIVLNHAPKWAEALTAGGQGLAQGLAQKRRDELYKLQIQRAAQDVAADQEQRDMERAQFKAQQISRERGIVQQDANIDYTRARTQGMQAEQAGRDADRTAMAERTPFDVALSDPSLPAPVRMQLARDKAIFGKLNTDEMRQRFAGDSLKAAKEAETLHKREALKAQITDRAALQAYGEGDDGAEGLLELLDAGADPEEVARKDLELRASMARSADKQLEHAQALAYAEEAMAAFPPGSEQSARARRAYAAFKSRVIEPSKLYSEIEAAQKPEMANAGPNPLQIRQAAHKMALDEARVLGITDPKQVSDLYAQRLAELMDASAPQGEGEPDPMGPLSSPAGQREAGRMRAQPQTGQASTQQGPAAGSPSGFPQSKSPGGEPAPPSKPVDQATAIQAAKEAVRLGASDDELRAILEAAGLDPDAPAGSLPKKTRKLPLRAGIEPGRP